MVTRRGKEVVVVPSVDASQKLTAPQGVLWLFPQPASRRGRDRLERQEDYGREVTL